MAIDNPLRNLMELISNVTSAHTAALFVLEADAETLSLRTHMSLSPQIHPGASFKIGEGLLGGAAFGLKTVTLDFSRETPPKLDLYRKREDLKAMMLIPLAEGADLKGLLYLDSKEQYEFPTKVQKMMTRFTDQILWHLQQEADPVTFEGEPADFMALVKWCRFLAESPDRRALSERFLRIPKHLLQMDAVAVAWFDEDGAGRVNAARGWGSLDTKTLKLQSGAGVFGQIVKTGNPLWVADSRGRPLALFHKQEHPETFGSLLAAPIHHQRRVAGVVLCAARSVNGFQAPDLARLLWMTTFAAQSPAVTGSGGTAPHPGPAGTLRLIYTDHFAAVNTGSVEEEIFSPERELSVLSIRLRNLEAFCRAHSPPVQESILNAAAERLSGLLPRPKLIFKTGDSTLTVLLVNMNPEQALAYEPQIDKCLKDPALPCGDTGFVPEVELGGAGYPQDGERLTGLVETSLARMTSIGDNVHA